MDNTVVPRVQQPGQRSMQSSTAAAEKKSGAGDKLGQPAKLSTNPPTISTISSSDFVSGRGGGALRPIDQKFGVNPCNGTASLSLPLRVSPARNSFQPSLELAYSSGQGHGPFGLGWALSLESITRQASRRIPQYGVSDVFLLSGEDDLVPLDVPAEVRDGYVVRRFRPRVEKGRARIEQWTSQREPGDVFWRTLSGTNVVRVFGRTDESRVMDVAASGNKRIFSWLLCEAYDAAGNAMRLAYKAENAQGVTDATQPASCEQGREAASRTRSRYIKSIRYGNRKLGRDLASWAVVPLRPEMADDWLFELVFDYGEHDAAVPDTREVRPWPVRQDPISSYVSGFEIRSYRLCRRVLMFHHFAEELRRHDYLVASHSFEYDESPAGSYMRSFTHSGHIWDEQGRAYITQSLPPLSFEYNEVPELGSLKVQSTKPACLQTLLASPRPGSVTRWVDLHGEGSPGLLVQLDGVWYYQRNENALGAGIEGEDEDEGVAMGAAVAGDDFGPVSTVLSRPGAKNYQASYFEDLDGNGLQDLVVVGRDHAEGFYESRGESEWTPMSAFPSALTLDTCAEPVMRADLTGSGRGDVLMGGDKPGEVVWHESLGKAGFGPQRRGRGPDDIPCVLAGDRRSGVFFADVNGDGVAECVRISNGRVSYWPNLGYGQFGTEIVMGRSPCFDRDDLFSVDRIRLLDLDGSGTTDIVYLSAQRGAVAYYNLCGNAWGEPVCVRGFPPVDNLSSVFALDLLGKGTPCLCWVGPEGGSTTDELIISYLDLGGSSKPHLLGAWSNGRGLSSRLRYSPSTKFYLQDARRCRPWATKLPFPVHVVSRVVEKDCHTLSTHTTRYRYHDGYYDGREREFRGFGAVEQWQTETFNISSGKPYAKPTCHTKLWFHTGAGEVSLEAPAGTSHPPKLYSAILSDLRGGNLRDAVRALKGSPLRTEVYGVDRSDRQTLPYSVVEHGYEVVMKQPSDAGAERPAIFRVLPRETLSLQYERGTCPLIRHELALQTNDFGAVTRSASVRYGHPRSALGDPDSRALQERHIIQYSEVDYTNSFDTPDCFSPPRECSRRQFHVLNACQDGLFQIEHLRKDDMAYFRRPTRTAEQAAEDVSTTVRVRGAESRTYYRSADMSQRLPLGVLQPFSVPDQDFDLALTTDTLEAVYGNGTTKAPFRSHSADDMFKKSGYVALDGDGTLWVPSSRSIYGPTGGAGGEIAAARKGFFIPVASVDPMGHTSTVDMDRWRLLPVKHTDAVGNVTEAANEYRTLQAAFVVDANGNVSEKCIDALGETTAVARRGKPKQRVGGSVDGIDPVVRPSVLRAFLEKPTRAEAARLLGRADSRQIRCLEMVKPPEGGRSLPPFSVTLTRTGHPGAGDSGAADLMVLTSYEDARGATLQEAHLVDWDAGDEAWAVTSAAVCDSGGHEIKEFTPFFAPNQIFRSVSEITSPSSMTFLDALGRPAGTLSADHTWCKSTQEAWSSTTTNAGSHLRLADPRTDADIGWHFTQLAPQTFRPSWYEAQMASGDGLRAEAASRSLVFIDSATVTHHDGACRDVIVVERAGSTPRTARFGYDVWGNRAVERDSLGRIVQRTTFDLLGRRLRTESMDAGTTVRLHDCLGKPVLTVNERGVQRRICYDPLHREVQVWILEPGRDEYLWCWTEYGEKVDEAEKDNLRGRVASIRDQAGRRDFVYDFKGNRTRETTKLAIEYRAALDWSDVVALEEGDGHTLTAVFDALDREVLATDRVGTMTHWTYPLFGDIAGVESSSSSEPSKRDWACHVSKAAFTADGLVARIDYGNSAHSTYEYDELARTLVRRKTWRDDGTVLEDVRFTSDCAGRLTHTEDVAQDAVYIRNDEVRSSRQYWYDARGRLERATGREIVGAGGTGGRTLGQAVPGSPPRSSGGGRDGRSLARYAESYRYDDADNIVGLRHESADGSVAGWTRSYRYDEKSLLEPSRTNNRLSQTEVSGAAERYGYDGAAGRVGCMTSMPGFSRLGWNSSDMMWFSARQQTKSGAPELTWFVYDSTGRRVRKVTDRVQDGASSSPRRLKETLYLARAETYHTYTGDGATRKRTTHTSHIGVRPDMSETPLVSREATTMLGEAEELTAESTPAPPARLTRYHLTTSLEVDDAARIVSYEEYTAFGVSAYLACRAGTEAPRAYRFAAYRRDAETGLYACGARCYVPWLARWTSPDALGTADGPNVYAYVHNDPVNYIDPTGTGRVAVGSGGNNSNMRRRRDSIFPQERYNLNDDRGRRNALSGPAITSGSDQVKMNKAREKAEEPGFMQGTKNWVSTHGVKDIINGVFIAGGFLLGHYTDPGHTVTMTVASLSAPVLIKSVAFPVLKWGVKKLWHQFVEKKTEEKHQEDKTLRDFEAGKIAGLHQEVMADLKRGEEPKLVSGQGGELDKEAPENNTEVQSGGAQNEQPQRRDSNEWYGIDIILTEKEVNSAPRATTQGRLTKDFGRSWSI